jgi:tight adherence protein B
MSGVVLAVAVVAVLLWPGRRRRRDLGVGVATRARPRRDAGIAGRLSRRRVALGVTAQTDLGDAIAAMAAPVHTGIPPAIALRAAVGAMPAGGPLQPLFDDLVDAAARGESIAAVWIRHADERGSADLRFVGQAWGLSEVTGAPLASALQTAEQVLRGRQRSRQRLATAVAGPRASMAVLALLPLCGPLVGLAFGVSPRALYLSSGAAMASVVTGVLLGVLAWWWSRRIIAGAIRPSRRGGARPG